MKSNRIQAACVPVVLLAGAMLAGAAQAAEMTVYKQPNFTGGDLTLRGDTSNLTGAGFQDQVSSIDVRSGRWQVCTQPDYKGDCVVIGPGEYRSLDQVLNHRIESAREITRYAGNRNFGEDRSVYASRHEAYADNRYNDRYASNREADNSYPMRRRYWANGTVELYEDPGFHGRALRVDEDTDGLQDSLGNGPSSLVIHEGRWQLCTRNGYEGACRVFDPGRYANLGRFGNQASSLRRIG